jgi:hypothetical protein
VSDLTSSNPELEVLKTQVAELKSAAEQQRIQDSARIESLMNALDRQSEHLHHHHRKTAKPLKHHPSEAIRNQLLPSFFMTQPNRTATKRCYKLIFRWTNANIATVFES